MTTRRKLLIALGSTAGVWPFAGRTQPAGRVPHVGYLSAGSIETNGAYLGALKDGLRELGYTDGQNIVIDVRWAGDRPSNFPQLAASLVKDKPGAIVGTCIPSTRAAKSATRSIPIVMSVDGDPVAAGLVASLARPGGNVTGTSTLLEELIPKWLELLAVAVPNVRDVAVLTNPDNVSDLYVWAKVEEAARRIGVSPVKIDVSVPADMDRGIMEAKKRGAGGLIVTTQAYFASQLQRVVPLIDRAGLAAIYGYSEFAEAGGLMSYGLSYRDYYRRLARYLDLVLRGAKPADLPVEQPTKIELVINLATARKLGIVMPPQLLIRADRVIE